MTPLETVRKAVIAAVPEIVYGGVFEGMKGWQYSYSFGRNGSYVSDPYPSKRDALIAAGASGHCSTRPIRLTDVLVAIQNKASMGKLYRVTEKGYILNVGVGDEDSQPILWNLTKDDLSQQSPETIEFLANLLK